MEKISIVGLRKYHNLTQREMAMRLNQGYSTYAQKEQKYRNWTLDDLIKVSLMFGVSIDDLEEVKELKEKEAHND